MLPLTGGLAMFRNPSLEIFFTIVEGDFPISLDTYTLDPKPSTLILRRCSTSNIVSLSSLEYGPELFSICRNWYLGVSVQNDKR